MTRPHAKTALALLDLRSRPRTRRRRRPRGLERPQLGRSRGEDEQRVGGTEGGEEAVDVRVVDEQSGWDQAPIT